MITCFYKLLDENEQVVYVGVTTRSVDERFREHKKKKQLLDNYTCIKIHEIIHPDIKDLKTFYGEYLKVSALEQQYINEEREKGANLLNISAGGEWGAHVLSKIQKEEFFKRHGTYDGYIEYRNSVNKTKAWLKHWIQCRVENKTETWLRNWILHRKQPSTESWLHSWISNKNKNKTKIWLWSWIRHRAENKTRRWLMQWIMNCSKNKTKLWLQHWINHSKENKTRIWLKHWISHRKKEVND